MQISEPHKMAKARRSPRGMASPFPVLERNIGRFVGLPEGKAIRGHPRRRLKRLLLVHSLDTLRLVLRSRAWHLTAYRLADICI